MKFAFLFLCILFSCSTAPRTRLLGEEERKALGLNGIVSDVKLCPTELGSTGLRVSGACEVVNCVAPGGVITCRAARVK